MTVRKPSQDSLPPDVYGILRSRTAACWKGMSSNFYAVVDGVLFTAGEGVLADYAARGARNRR